MDELQKSDAKFPQPRSRGFVDKAINNAGMKYMLLLRARIKELEEFIAKITMTGNITEEYVIEGRKLLRNKLTSDTKI